MPARQGTTREERIRQLREADEGILICTETAAESLNLQFCTAVINYDMPWNPMTVEQRIGRIEPDRTAKKHGRCNQPVLREERRIRRLPGDGPKNEGPLRTTSAPTARSCSQT